MPSDSHARSTKRIKTRAAPRAVREKDAETTSRQQRSSRGRNKKEEKAGAASSGRGAASAKLTARKRVATKTAKKKPSKAAGGSTHVERFAGRVLIDNRKGTPCGMAMAVLMMAAQDDKWKTHLNTVNLCLPGESRGSVAWNRAVRTVTSNSRRKRAAELLNAVANPHRLTILGKLLQGPATYQALVKATGLKVGPLYHHIGQLRLASLVAPRERDLYRLTVGGQNALLGLLALLPFMTDSRVVDE